MIDVRAFPHAEERRSVAVVEQLDLFEVLGETEDGDSLWEAFPALERAEMVTRLSWVLLKAARVEPEEPGGEQP